MSTSAASHSGPHGGDSSASFGDDEVAGGEIVRGFMLTRGRTRAASAELPIETVVSVPPGLGTTLDLMDREHRRIRSLLTGPMSIAEVSAHLKIPLRAAVVLVSEMVAAGSLSAGETVGNSDTDLLHKIRTALQLL